MHKKMSFFPECPSPSVEGIRYNRIPPISVKTEEKGGAALQESAALSLDTKAEEQKMTHVLYNPQACGGMGEKNAREMAGKLNLTEADFQDIVTLPLARYLDETPAEEQVIVAGGDGTLNHFVNRLEGRLPALPVYYYPAGSGNDFMHDVQERAENGLVLLNPFLEGLPGVTVAGRTRLFLNGVGYGIDGYCCQEGDRMRAEGRKKVNYAAIAIRGLLGRFRPLRATVTVDGETRTFDHVWLAPAMKGRYYGGGMMIAPGQLRDAADGMLTVVVLHCRSKLKTLIAFPGIFKGEHVKRTEMVWQGQGHDITVSFDRPCPLQIDGETVLNVTEYRAISAAAAQKETVQTA